MARITVYLRIQDDDFRYAAAGVLREDVEEGRSVHHVAFRLQTRPARRNLARITSVALDVNGVRALRDLPAGEEHLHFVRTFRLRGIRDRVRQVPVLVEPDVDLENAIESTSSEYHTGRRSFNLQFNSRESSLHSDNSHALHK